MRDRNSGTRPGRQSASVGGRTRLPLHIKTLDTLRAAAFGRGRFIDDLAEDLTTRRLPLTDLAD